MNLIRNEADIDEGLARLVEIDPGARYCRGWSGAA